MNVLEITSHYGRGWWWWEGDAGGLLCPQEARRVLGMEASDERVRIRVSTREFKGAQPMSFRAESPDPEYPLVNYARGHKAVGGQVSRGLGLAAGHLILSLGKPWDTNEVRRFWVRAEKA